MAPQLEISIPNTTISSGSKPYTIYNISLRLPLRSFTVQKRYSEFVTLNQQLTDQVGSSPPAQVPSKSWFSRTVSNPELTEERRKGLEAYLKTINTDQDARWRNTSAWRTFLDLPSSFSNITSSASNNLQSSLTSAAGYGAAITDPTIWLDTHRDLKAQLHEARLQLTTRDQAPTTQKQHEAGAAAKSALVKAGSLIKALEDGLTNIQKQQRQPSSDSWGSSAKLGEGEIRRRRDLLVSATKDKDSLESLLSAMTQKSKIDSAIASVADKSSLISATISSKPQTGRVLGRETTETRSLDNTGLLQLQKQKMSDQDLDVEELRKIVQRQKELGIAINNELEVQNEMLKMVDEDVDRVQGKIDVAKRRIGKIS